MAVRPTVHPRNVETVRFPAADPVLLDLVLEAHPHPTLLVDAELRIAHANRAARALLEPARGARPGDALRCLEAASAEGGCGSGGRCAHCLLRKVVRSALDGVAARERALLARAGPGAPDLHLLAAATPLERGGARHAILVVEDLADVLPLPALLPVCAGCSKIRDAGGTWLPFPAYLDEPLGVEVSHGLCDECMQRLYPEGGGA
jgi:hypothetical protein